MSLARLSPFQLQDALVCLGPDISALKATCRFSRGCVSKIDLVDEVLKWHCVNTDLMQLQRIYHRQCLELLGRMPLRCSLCEGKSKNRQFFRYTQCMQDGHRKGVLYLCCRCVYEENRLFLIGRDGILSRAGLGEHHRVQLMLTLLSRTRMPRENLLDACLASLKLQRLSSRKAIT